MFDDLRRAWQQAVSNFWHELEADDVDGRGRAVYREVGRVRSHLADLDTTIGKTREQVEHEKEQADACARRERMARGIGDLETARLAAEYGQRHRERADVLGRKLDVLEAERRLCRRDLGAMERALQDGRAGPLPPELDDLNRHPNEGEFRTMEEADRARTAADRLDELKRRMSR